MANSATIGKINQASLKVLKILSLLFEKNMTMNELVDAMNNNGLGPCNNFVVSKYINTCKSCGIDIQKINNKYTILNFPIGLRFSPTESELLFEVKSLSENLKSGELENTIDKFISKLHLAFYKSGTGLQSSKNYRIIKIFEKACLSQCDIKIIFKDKTTYNCFPKEIQVVDEKIIFKTYNNDESKELNPDDIIDIRIIDDKVLTKESMATVIFEIKGSLAKRYQPRENEQITHFKNNGSIIITNRYEDKKQLLHRLMRYDSSCKVLKPKAYVAEMQEMIANTLKNYE